jgi:hypothetical protein
MGNEPKVVSASKRTKLGKNQRQRNAMSDAPEKEKSAVPADSAARLRKAKNAFLERLFAHGYRFEESFSKVCDDGCSREEFGKLLYVVCLTWSFRTDSLHLPRAQKRLVNSGNISKSQLKALPKEMRAIADTIDSLNATSLAPARDIKMAPYDAKRQMVREYMIRQYETLPWLLRVYSSHLENFSKSAIRTVKRLTLAHLLAVKLVRYVEDQTGSPHYVDLSNLLEEGLRVAGGTESTPRFLSTAGLTKLYQRWAESAGGPRRAASS